jgi:hypothetical protein
VEATEEKIVESKQGGFGKRALLCTALKGKAEQSAEAEQTAPQLLQLTGVMKSFLCNPSTGRQLKEGPREGSSELDSSLLGSLAVRLKILLLFSSHHSS